MPFHHIPDARDIRIVRCAVVDKHRGSVDQRSKHEPRSHHPSHVAHPVHGLAALEVHAVSHVLGGLDREAAVRVDGALRPSRRAARVNDHNDGFCVRSLCICLCRLVRHEIVPPVIAAFGPRDVLAVRAPVYDDMLHGGHRSKCLVCRLLHGDDPTAAVEPI